MKSTGLIIIALLQLTSCISYSNSQRNMSNLSGLYTSNIGNERLDLDTDGYYILYNDTNIVVNKECCDIKSKGKWTCIAPNVINLISENYYEKQKGFEYNLIKENRLSQDSLYFHVVFPDVFLKLEEKQCQIGRASCRERV